MEDWWSEASEKKESEAGEEEENDDDMEMEGVKEIADSGITEEDNGAYDEGGDESEEGGIRLPRPGGSKNPGNKLIEWN